MKPIIRVENLSKQYFIGGLNARYWTFREMLAGTLMSPFRGLRPSGGSAAQESVWALKDVTFDIQPGEVVGLIGDNGAGKSTLLKILSRIVGPTSGGFELYGRVGSLLEVGTGFHPDLTGRENIFMSGAILGIKRSELAKRFDEIVAFSGVEKFIDTPVKWYSSGMYLRLAFSVAVHLDTEILTMDEVLAVGDVSFQQKCIDKMHEIRQDGRTILFVSHAMSAVTRLCKRVILLEKGRIANDGPAQEVVNAYVGASWQVTEESEWYEPAHAPGRGAVRLERVRVCAEDGQTTASIDIRLPVGIEISYEVLEPNLILSPTVELFNDSGVHLFSTHDVASEWRRRPRPVGHYRSTVWIPGNCLAEGNFLAHVAVVSHTPATMTHAEARNAVTLQMVDTLAGDSARGDYIGPIGGVVRPWLNWTTDFYVGRKEREANSYLSGEIPV